MNDQVWQVLRQMTATAHRDLELCPRLSRQFQPDYRWDEFLDLLAVMADLYAGLEAWLAPTLAAQQIGYQPRRDLLLPVMTRPPRAIDCRALQAAESDAACWGALYVIEGSILGGQVITRRMREHFGSLPDAVVQFYQPYADPGQQWRHVRQCLGQALDHRGSDLPLDDMASIERAAKQTVGLRPARDKMTLDHRGSDLPLDDLEPHTALQEAGQSALRTFQHFADGLKYPI